MKLQPSKKESSFRHGMMPDSVFANWMTAVALLFQNYKQLSNLLTTHHLELNVSVNQKLGIGQCPVRELQQLVDLFERELAILLIDLNRSRCQGSPTRSESYKKVISHTRRLQELNCQAQIRLLLAGQSAT